MKHSRAHRRKRAPWLEAVLGFFLILFFMGGLFSTYYFFLTVRDVIFNSQTASWTDLPIIGNLGESQGVLPNVTILKRKERINILLLGIDQRRGEEGAFRTDTMIVVSVDPLKKTAAMLSIPRDLYVDIPGFGENRINVANFLGETSNYPGGGPTLAKETVQYNLGIPIHYYILINFDGFRRVVDILGGITVDVEEAIDDYQYPDENYGYQHIYIPAGLQMMDGETALRYARSRHGGTDFERARRQQKVLLAIRDRALSLDIIPKIPALWAAREDMVRTDLQLDEIISLAQLGRELEAENIKSGVIDDSMTEIYIVPETGANVLWPNRDKIGELVKELFSDEPATVLVASPDQVERLAEEGARIEVQNGTSISGLAERTAALLQEQGCQIVGYTNADRFDYPHTIIIDYNNGKDYTIAFLKELFNVAPENVRRSPNPRSEVDVRLILGDDLDLPVLSSK
ncbi:MAG: LCP family protein [Anaerolineae bacterium]